MKVKDDTVKGELQGCKIKIAEQAHIRTDEPAIGEPDTLLSSNQSTGKNYLDKQGANERRGGERAVTELHSNHRKIYDDVSGRKLSQPPHIPLHGNSYRLTGPGIANRSCRADGRVYAHTK